MIFPSAYIQFLVHFHGDRDYFECHEVLEEHWKQSDSKNRNSVWVGLIQMAVSLYHHRRNNQIGAIKLMEKALKNFNSHQNELKLLGLNHLQLMDQLYTLLINMQAGTAYQSINIPISNDILINICKSKCKQQGLQWCSISDLTNEEIINRHKMRDRTDIEFERLNSLIRKQIERQQNQLIAMN